jgi:hypothetical protein
MSDSSSDGRRTSAKKTAKGSAKRKDVRVTSEGVLAGLPRTRPQRSSARRDASRRDTSAKTATAPAPTRNATTAKPSPTPARKARKATTAKPTISAPARKATTPKKRPARTHLAAQPLQDPAPRQGFEAERDHLGGPVQPPGGLDLFASAAELAGELTKTGVSAGGRLLKDALARLPLN